MEKLAVFLLIFLTNVGLVLGLTCTCDHSNDDADLRAIFAKFVSVECPQVAGNLMLPCSADGTCIIPETVENCPKIYPACVQHTEHSKILFNGCAYVYDQQMNKCDATYAGQGMTLCMCNTTDRCNADPGVVNRLDVLATGTDLRSSSNQVTTTTSSTPNSTRHSIQTATTTATRIMGATLKIETSAPSVAIAAASNPHKNSAPTLTHTYTTILAIFASIYFISYSYEIYLLA